MRLERTLHMLVAAMIAGFLQASVLAQGDAPELEPLPPLALDDVAEPVRKVLTEARERVERTVAEAAADVALAEAYGHFADVAFAHELISHARIAYGNAIALRPNRQEWHYLLGLAEIGEGNLEAGIESLSRALEIYERDHAALIHRGRAYLETGNDDSAEQDFRWARQLEPESAAALGGLGRVALQRENHARAVEYLEEAVELAPRANRLHHLLGTAYRAMGERERAGEHLARSGEVTEPMADPILDQVRLLSRSPQFYREMGLSQADAGNLETAVQMLGQARALAPADDTILRDHGEVLARLGRLDEAYTAFSSLARRQPDSAESHYYLGQIEELRGNHDAALAAYRQVLDLDRNHAGARESIAHVLLAQKATDRAAEEFERLADEAADTATAARFRYWRGITELAAGDCRSAVPFFEQAHALTDGYNEAVLTAMARLRATCSPGDLGEALEWAAMLYDDDPGLETAVTLAMVHAANGKFDDAVDFQAQAMFEALKSGELENRPELEANMIRYRAEQPAERPYGPNDPVFGLGRGGR